MGGRAGNTGLPAGDGPDSAVIGTNRLIKRTKTRWLCRVTIQTAMKSLHEAHTVTFVEKTTFHSLDTYENKWYNQFDAQNNIKSTILPHVK